MISHTAERNSGRSPLSTVRSLVGLRHSLVGCHLKLRDQLTRTSATAFPTRSTAASYLPISEQKLDRNALSLPSRRPGPDPARTAPTPNSTGATLPSSLDAHPRPRGIGSIVRNVSRSTCIVPPGPREAIGASWSLQSSDLRKRAKRER